MNPVDRITFLGRLVTNTWFDRIFFFLVLVNTVELAAFHHGMSVGFAIFLSAFTGLFVFSKNHFCGDMIMTRLYFVESDSFR